MHLFERILSVSEEDTEFYLKGISSLNWESFVLNPRRLRGSDFLMRWSQGVWSENRIIEAINESGKFYAIPYGPSGTAPTDDVRAFELYFERLETAGLRNIKRPDLLIFRKADEDTVGEFLKSVGGVSELPFLPENKLKFMLVKAIAAIECENSLWKSKKMPDYKTEFSTQKRLGGKPGLKKTAVLPTIIIKEEDRTPLKKWQQQNNIPIHVWHVFYDQAFGISLDEAERLLREGLVEPTNQIFQAPGGATSRKTIYKIYYRYGYPLGSSIETPSLVPAFVEDKNGHILPYVKFDGGKIKLHEKAVKVLGAL